MLLSRQSLCTAAPEGEDVGRHILLFVSGNVHEISVVFLAGVSVFFYFFMVSSALGVPAGKRYEKGAKRERGNGIKMVTFWSQSEHREPSKKS